jgi:hypothetical protein
MDVTSADRNRTESCRLAPSCSRLRCYGLSASGLEREPPTTVGQANGRRRAAWYTWHPFPVSQIAVRSRTTVAFRLLAKGRVRTVLPSLDGDMMTVALKPGDPPELSAPKALFHSRVPVSAVPDQFAVAENGERFSILDMPAGGVELLHRRRLVGDGAQRIPETGAARAGA